MADASKAGMRTWMVALVALLHTAAGCHGTTSVMVERPRQQSVDDAYTRSWVEQIKREGRTGDILLSRGYAVISDVIDVATTGREGDAEVSHSVIYDAERGTVIEGVRPVVREVPLEKFVSGAHHVMIVRPAGLSDAERKQVVVRARSRIGAGYDFTALVGIDMPDRYTCSELVVWAIRAAERGYRVDLIVAPTHMTRYGTVIFDSGPRDG